MFRTGIVDLATARRRPLEDTDRRRYAITLLDDLERDFRPEDERLLSRLYDEVVVGGNVYKTTRAGRFRDLDERLVEDVRTRFGPPVDLVAHDVGASNAVTSLELFRALDALRPARVHASDYFDAVFVVRPDASGPAVVFDPDRRPIQYIGTHFVLAAAGESRRWPLNRWLLAKAAASLAPRAKTALDTWLDGAAKGGAGSSVAHRLSLWHPTCKTEARNTARFTLGHHDLFVPSGRRWHLIRAMNVLNPHYFPADRITAAVRTLAADLEEGGLLVIGRSVEEEGGTNRASAFLKQGPRLRPAWDFGAGAEVRDLVLEVGCVDVPEVA